MARVGNTQNLEDGSRYDLLAFSFMEGYPIGGIKLGFGDTPKRISGVQKVSQVFTKTLLTTTGSDVVHGNRGTIFSSFTGAYNLQSTDNGEMKAAINNAIENASDQAKAILNVPTEGLTSQLESATMVGVEVLEDGVSVQIQILTKAGETAPIALPFTSLGIQVNE